jgi:hypothetical protein
MQPKIELSQVRTTGEIIDDSILFFKQNWKPLLKSYFVICGLFWLAGLIISIINQIKQHELDTQGGSFFNATNFLTILFSFINFVLISLTVLSYVALYKEKEKNAPTVEEVWVYVKYYLLRGLWSTFLLTLLLAGATLLCIIPGIYLLPIVLLIITIIVIENASLNFAFNRGFQLIKNNWWSTFTVLIVIWIIVGAIMMLMAIPVSIITAAVLFSTNINHDMAVSIAIAVVLNSLQVLYILPVIAMVVAYYNLNEQKDDLHIMQRIEMLGTHSSDTDHLPTEEY